MRKHGTSKQEDKSIADTRIKRWLNVPNKVNRASGVTFYRRTINRRTYRRAEGESTSETQNQAVPNIDTATTAAASAAAAATTARTRIIASVTQNEHAR